MDKLVTYPTQAKIYGNIISNRLGYVESLDDFESKQCEVEMIDMEFKTVPTGIPEEEKNFNIYGIKLVKNLDLENHFSQSMQYCSYENQGNVFICDHIDQGEWVDDVIYSVGIGDVFDVTLYKHGYTFTVKEDYLQEFEIEIEEVNDEYWDETQDEWEDDEYNDEIQDEWMNEEYWGEIQEEEESEEEGGTNETITVLADDVESWFLLFHDSGEVGEGEETTTEYGVKIPSGMTTVNYSFDFMASLDVAVFVGFVFFDADGRILESTISDESLINNNIGDGTLIDGMENKYRNRQQYIAEIPEGATFVSPKFKLPRLIYPKQWIHINKNCILFDNPYINFVRNNVINNNDEEE